MLYSELTMRHFEAGVAAGEIAGENVFRGAAGRIAEGTWVQFDVRLNGADGGPGQVSEARFRAYGCPHVIAAADWICQQACGRLADQRLAFGARDLRDRFGAPIEKLGRLLIVEDAWSAAMRAAAQSVHPSRASGA